MAKSRYNAGKKSRIRPSNIAIEWYALPIGAALMVISLAVRILVLPTNEDIVALINTTQVVSMFTAIKYQLLVVFAVVMVIVGIVAFKRFAPPKDKSLRIYFIAVGIFLAFTFFSASLADYTQVAFGGFYDQNEGFITIVSYIVLFVYTLLVYLKTEDYRFIIWPLMVVVVFNVVISAIEMGGVNVFDLEWVRKIYVPREWWPQLLTARSAFIPGSGTFANSNYLAAFSAMVMPLFAALALTQKKLLYRAIFAVFAVLSLMLLFFSRASSGVVGLAVMIVVALVVFKGGIFKHWKISAVVIALGIAVVLAVNSLTGNTLVTALTPITDGLNSMFFEEDKPISDTTGLKDVRFEGQTLILDTNSDVVTVSMRDNEYIFTDSSGVEHTPTVDGDRLRFTEEHMVPFMFDLDTINEERGYHDILLFYYNGKMIAIFGYDEDGFYMRNPFTLARQEIQRPEVWLFEGEESLGSGRGYIWGRSLPMIPQNLILGAGPDNYVYEFPQFDVMGKAGYFGISTLITKPHNMYLQILINNGGVAFVAFMSMIVLYFYDSFKLYTNKTRDLYKSGMGIAVMLSMVAYLVSGLFNDSLVYVSPVFWILFGLGVAINYKNKLPE